MFPAELKDILSAVGSIATTSLVVYAISHKLLTHELIDYIFCSVQSLVYALFRSVNLTMVINELDGLNINEIYQAAEMYLGTKDNPKASRLNISRPEKDKHFKITIGDGQVIQDTYNGQKFEWILISRKPHYFISSSEEVLASKSEVRSFELTFHKKNKDLVISSYLPYIINEARNKQLEKKTINIFTSKVNRMVDVMDIWTPVTFSHPATFETLAMDPDQKGMIMKDLKKFVGRKEYYRKIGKAWKRGYLLHGPPGTGKSSLIAAIANYLNFDVYDLELAGVGNNSELRTLLVGTGNKSILVIEDIDCTVELQEKLINRDSKSQRENINKVTLSGLLNFIDGLWSSLGDERIIIFTTNHLEKLDPALLRPGRMDMHINMSYCTPCGFKLLASNYLGIKDHPLFREIEGLIGRSKTTPAEVAETLLKNGDDHDVALRELINFIQKKMMKNAEEKEPKAESDNDEEEI